MGTQGPGRKRIPNREKLTAEDDALNQIAREAEARLAAKRAARAEAREIRMKELERQQKELFHSHKEDSERYSRHSRRHASMSDDEERMSVGSRGSFRPSDYSGFLGSGSRASSRASSARASPVVEERPDRDFIEKGSRTASTLSAATLASLGGASSRRGSCDTSFSVETEASIRDMKDSLAEAEEKYRKAMVSNAQLHNEKSTLMYQTETLKEELSHMEELLWESRRHCDDRSKELERERQAHSVLQFQFKEMRETVTHTEELLTEVSELRLRSSSYCQEVSDLQEVLQWKEKKMATLERQREISDLVGMERDRLRDEVVRLRELLKKHGVSISPEVSTNGEAAEAEDESATRLAQESSHGGRESMLGKVQEQQQAEQDDMKYHRCQTYRRSRSLNVSSSREQTKTDSFKQVKRSEKLERTERLPGRTKASRKQTRNKGSGKDPTKKSKIRQDRDERVRKQMNKRGSCVQTCESKSVVGRSLVDDEACKGTTKPHSESGVKSSVASTQDVTGMESTQDVTDMESTQDVTGMESTQDVTDMESTQDVTGMESTQGVTDMESTQDVTGMESTQDVTDMESTQDVTGMESTQDVTDMESTQDVTGMESTQGVTDMESTQDVTGMESTQDVTGIESTQDVTGIESSYDDQICKSQTDVGETQRFVRQSEREAKCVNQSSPVRRASPGRVHRSKLVPPRPLEDMILDNKAMVSGIKNQTVQQHTPTPEKPEAQGAVMTEDESPSSDRDFLPKCSSAVGQICENQERDVNTGRGVTCAEGRALLDVSACCEKHNKGNEFSSPTSVDHLKNNECVDRRAEKDDDGCPDDEDKVLTDNEKAVQVSTTSGSLVQKQQTGSESLGGTQHEASKNKGAISSSGVSAEEKICGEQSDTHENLEYRCSNEEERPQCNSETGTPQSSALSASAVEKLKDCSRLEKRIHTMMRGFVETQGFTSELSKVVGSLHRWISDLEETLKIFEEDMSDQSHTADGDWTGQMMSIEVTREDESLKDVPEDTFEESSDQRAAGRSANIKDRSVSRMMEGVSVEVHPQTSDVSVDLEDVYEVQDLSASDDHRAAEETPDTISIIPNFTEEVIPSSPEGKTGANYEDLEEMQSQSDPKLTSCSEGFVFVESFFAEAAETKIFHTPVVETQLKHYQTLSLNPPAAQRSKVRRLLEVTAHEIKAMALPELVLNLHEGRIDEDQLFDESTGSNTEDVEELSAADVDSCEEVDEEAEQQPAMQQYQSETEGVSEDVEVVPGVSSEKLWRGRKGIRVGSRKHKPACKIS